MLHKDMVQTDYVSTLRVFENPQLRSTTNQKVNLVGTLVLPLHIEEAGICVLLEVFENQAVFVLVVTSFIDKSVKEIFLATKEIISYSSQPVPIFMVSRASNDNGTTTRTTDVADDSVLVLETRQNGHVVHVSITTTLYSIS